MVGDVIVAPFSNSDIRDWPADHYAELVCMLAEAWTGRGTIRIIGAPGQRLRARDIVRHADPNRVVNDCGRFPWEVVVEQMKTAACVIGNNSGIAHLAASFGAQTICLFGGSHQRREWMPIGANVTLMSRAIACSPCHLDHRMICPYDKACLREITPTQVARIVLNVLGHAAEPASAELAEQR